MTRQNVTDGPREILTRKCPTCHGEGVVVSEQTAVVDAERRLRALAASKPRTKAFKVELNEHVAELLIGPGASRLEEIEAQTRRRFFIEGKAAAAHDHFVVLDEGTLEKVAPKDAPVGEGESVEVKLVEVGRHDGDAAVAKLDGWNVSVAGAAKLVGKKVNVRIARVFDGTAFAVLTDGLPEAAQAPITAEAQAEKPTRTTRAKKVEEPEVTVEEVVEETETETAAEEAKPPAKKRTRRGSRGGRGRKKKPTTAAEAAVAEESPEEEPETATEQPAEEAPAKKKTRRGSRGGRGRKKPAGVPAAANGAGEPEAVAPRRPTIHVPETEAVSKNGDETAEAAPRKKTRRGSRGGRRRRKPAASAAEQRSDES
jgi:ribonuclease G